MSGNAARSDAQKLAAAIGQVREIGRFQDGYDRETNFGRNDG